MASAYNTSSDRYDLDGAIIAVTFLVSYIFLLLPLLLYVLYLGFQQWKSKQSDPSWSVSHSDFFTYNLAVMELFGFVGFVVTLHGKLTRDKVTSDVGFLANKLAWFGQLLFPIFTCVEHYLAVVHPVTYVNLKHGKGLKIRNVSTAVVWLLTFTGTVYMYKFRDSYDLFVMIMFQMFACLAAMVFCSVSVLHVLIRPKPGDQNRGRFDKSKQRAVSVIIAITCMLLLRFVGNIVVSSLCVLDGFHCPDLVVVIYWLNLSSTWVLVLLFLQKAGKLPDCKRNADSE